MKKGHGSKFARKKEEAILALLTKRSVDEAAISVGVAPNTLLNWMKDPEFDEELRKARRVTFRQATGWLHQGVKNAVSTMMKLMVDPAHRRLQTTGGIEGRGRSRRESH